MLKNMFEFKVCGGRALRITVGTIIMALLVAGSAGALSNGGGDIWTHSRGITISNLGGGLTDYQVMVNLTDSSFPANANSSGSDIRFTNSDGVELAYWIEEWNYSAQRAKVWVNVTSIPAGASSIRMWWGNQAAKSSSNGDETFVFFDDFNDASYTDKWTPGTANYYGYNNEWVQTQNSWDESNGFLRGVDGTAGRGDWIFITSKQNVSSRGIIIETKIQPNKNSNGGPRLYVNPYEFCTLLAGGEIVAYNQDWRAYSGNGDCGTNSTISDDGSIVNGIWYNLKLVVDVDGSFVKFYNGNELKVSDNYYIIPEKTVPIVLNTRGDWGNDADVRYDYIRVRKYTASEPTVTYDNDGFIAEYIYNGDFEIINPSDSSKPDGWMLELGGRVYPPYPMAKVVTEHYYSGSQSIHFALDGYSNKVSYGIIKSPLIDTVKGNLNWFQSQLTTFDPSNVEYTIKFYDENGVLVSENLYYTDTTTSIGVPNCATLQSDSDMNADPIGDGGPSIGDSWYKFSQEIPDIATDKFRFEIRINQWEAPNKVGDGDSCGSLFYGEFDNFYISDSTGYTPHISVTDISFSDLPVETKPLTITATIKNNRDYDVANTQVNFLDGVNEIGSTLIDIPAHSSASVSITWENATKSFEPASPNYYTNNINVTAGSSSHLSKVMIADTHGTGYTVTHINTSELSTYITYPLFGELIIFESKETYLETQKVDVVSTLLYAAGEGISTGSNIACMYAVIVSTHTFGSTSPAMAICFGIPIGEIIKVAANVLHHFTEDSWSKQFQSISDIVPSSDGNIHILGVAGLYAETDEAGEITSDTYNLDYYYKDEMSNWIHYYNTKDYLTTQSSGQTSAILECPANLHAYDSQGRHVGVNALGEIDLEIPGAYYTGPDQDPEAIIILDNLDDITYKIEALDEGEFNFTVTHSTEIETTTVTYRNVPITGTTEAKIDVIQENPTFTMEIDFDGDGTTDETKEPDSIEVIGQPTTAPIPSGIPVESSTGKGIVYFDVDSGNIEDLTSVNMGDLPDAPSEANLEYGPFRFNVTGLEIGGSATLTLTFPDNLPASTTYWKYGPTTTDITPHWYTIPCTVVGNELTITIIDGGLGDNDFTANGIFADPGGPSTPLTSAPIPEFPTIVLPVLAVLGLIILMGRKR